VETLEDYLGSLASTQPVPGGGSAATIVGALGASLVAMVARISANNPKLATPDETALRVAAEADTVREALMLARERDERAFAAVVAAQALPRGDDRQTKARAGAIEAALHDAAAAPLEACQLCLAVLRLCTQLLEISSRALASDVGCAAEFGSAALAACAYNVRINHRYMRDTAAVERQSAELTHDAAEGATLLAGVRDGVRRSLEP
jgi:methenyltetrahydrofolate cyclohydrolase